MITSLPPEMLWLNRFTASIKLFFFYYTKARKHSKEAQDCPKKREKASDMQTKTATRRTASATLSLSKTSTWAIMNATKTITLRTTQGKMKEQFSSEKPDFQASENQLQHFLKPILITCNIRFHSNAKHEQIAAVILN